MRGEPNLSPLLATSCALPRLHVTLARTDEAELNAGEPKEDGREGGEERVEEA